VPVGPDTTSAFAAYAGDRLVSAEWLSGHLGTQGLKVVEADEDRLIYDIGHIPGAVKIDWRSDLSNHAIRDFVDGAAFAALMDRKGIRREDTVVVYGDHNNWWAALTVWVFSLFGHADVRLLDGGRDAWINENRDTAFDVPEATTSGYPVVERSSAGLRAFQADVAEAIGAAQLVDARSSDEYTGEAASGYHPDGPLRAGHIPTAVNIPWHQVVRPDGRFRSAAELRKTYAELNEAQPVIAYCHTGERSAHTWFVLKHLLGFADVRVYDGSWAEWGNMVRVPVARGAEPGQL
jgi:thiosulfate/3-mercaptopyruvate sulfurtransferase